MGSWRWARIAWPDHPRLTHKERCLTHLLFVAQMCTKKKTANGASNKPSGASLKPSPVRQGGRFRSAQAAHKPRTADPHVRLDRRR